MRKGIHRLAEKLPAKRTVMEICPGDSPGLMNRKKVYAKPGKFTWFKTKAGFVMHVPASKAGKETRKLGWKPLSEKEGMRLFREQQGIKEKHPAGKR